MERNERYGLRNLKGKKITPVKFDEIEIIDGFDEGLAIWTFSSVNLFSLNFNNWFQLLEDWLDRSPYKEKPQRMGVINLDGKKILPLKYGFVRLEESKDFSYFSVSVYQEDYYRYNENKGIYSLDGKEIVPPVFDWADNYVDSEQGLIRVQKTDFYGMYDLEGNDLFLQNMIKFNTTPTGCLWLKKMVCLVF